MTNDEFGNRIDDAGNIVGYGWLNDEGEIGTESADETVPQSVIQTDEYDSSGELIGTTQSQVTNNEQMYIPENQSDARHVYVGRDGRGDVWQIADSSGMVHEWASHIGEPSGAVIAGSMTPLGPAGPMTVAQVPGDKNPDHLRHVFVGTDWNGDHYRLNDERGHWMEWAVAINSDSRSTPIWGPFDRGLSGLAAYTPNSGSGGAVVVLPPTPVVPVVVFPVIPPGTEITTQYGSPKQDNARHRFEKRVGNRDYWQIWDGYRTIQWQVAAGASSSQKIAGTDHVVDPAFEQVVAPNDGYIPTPSNPLVSIQTPNVTTTPGGAPTVAVSDNTKNIVMVALAAAGFGLKLFK